MEMKVARFWNLLPWEFNALLPDRKAELVACYLANNEAERYYQSEMAKLRPKEKDTNHNRRQ